MIQITKTALARLYAGQPTIKILPHKKAAWPRPPYPCGSTQAIHRQPDAPGDPIGEAKCRAHITRVTEIRLLELTDNDAQAAGHTDLEELMADWVQRRGLWNEQSKAWVLHLTYDPSEPVRLLEPQAQTLVGDGRPLPEGKDTPADHGYIGNDYRAIRHEPEAVDDDTLKTLADAARVRDEHTQRRRERDLDNVPLGRRLDHALATAKSKGTDVRDEERRLLHTIISLERKVHLRAA